MSKERKYRPLGTRTLIETEKIVDSVIGKIILPRNASTKPMMGVVRAVGTDPELCENVHVGETVIYNEYGAEEVHMDDGEVLFFVHLADLITVVE